MEQDQKPQQSNTKSEYELKRQKKIEDENRKQKNKTLKRFSKITLIVLIAGGGIGALTWWNSKQPQTPPSEIISRNGIHWHPELYIYIKGVRQEISANIGIGINHQPIHTHDTSGVLHLEMQGVVREKDVKLVRFFEIWGKEFNSNCIFDYCNGPGGTIKMFVNSQENTEFENYQMKNGDKIEIRYE